MKLMTIEEIKEVFGGILTKENFNELNKWKPVESKMTDEYKVFRKELREMLFGENSSSLVERVPRNKPHP